MTDNRIVITDTTGYIVDRATREAFDRIVDRHSKWSTDGITAAEAFLKLVERYAARGIRILPYLPE